jgi:S1-C subfamily serine protease
MTVGDLIISVDGLPVTGVDDLVRLLDGERIGRRVELKIVRATRIFPFMVTPIARVS